MHRTILAVPAALFALVWSTSCKRLPDSPPPVDPAVADVLDADVRGLLEDGTIFELLSLDPTPIQIEPLAEGEADFHDYQILGRTTVTPEEREALLAALYTSIAEADRTLAAACFNPRHGLHAADEAGNSVDLVICFECVAMHIVMPDGQQYISISRDGRRAFNRVVKAHRLPQPTS